MTKPASVRSHPGIQTTMALALLIVVVIVAIGTAAIVAALRRYRKPPELRGDWWTAFEREFRAYARQASRQDRAPRRHRGEAA